MFDLNRLYNADCMEAMKEIPDKFFQLAICDPPYWSRKKALLEFVKARGASVGDLETQLEFLLHELNAGYAAVLSVLKTTGSVRAASDAVLLKFERPADQSTAAQERRAGYGQTYYNKYAAGAEKGQGTMTAKEKQNRANIVAIAESFFGCKESDGSHKKIIDIYNADKPLARGYPMKYTDAWCACFVSVVSIRGGALAVMPKEVGCGKMIELYQKLGRWQENDAYVPAPGDVVFYDWNDGPNYAATDNTAAPDHVGIVVSVTGSTIKVIEGNMSNAVGYSGYIHPVQRARRLKRKKAAGITPAAFAYGGNKEYEL